MLAPKFRTLATAIVIGALSAAISITPHAHAGASSPVMSPEEAVVHLIPYELTQQDLPAGYKLYGDPQMVTTAALASASQDAWRTFNSQRKAGRLIYSSQRLLSPTDAGAISQGEPDADANVSVFDMPEDAKAYATGQSLALDSSASESFTPVNLSSPLGLASAAWRVSLNAQSVSQSLGLPELAIPQQPPQYYIRWQRGDLAFSLSGPAGQSQADAETLAAAIDSAEQKRPSVTLGSPTIQPASTEAQRLQAGIELDPLLASVNAPDGYAATRQRLDTPADYVASDPDPTAALQRIDGQWRRVAGVDREFTSVRPASGTSEATGPSAGASAVAFVADAALDADGQGAIADLAYEPGPTGWTSGQVNAPVQLGDITMAFFQSGPGRDGTPRENTMIGWTHGGLTLYASMAGPAGSTSMDQVVAFAQQLEAQFQVSGAPTAVPAVLNDGWNLVGGNGQMLIGAQFGPSAYAFGPGDTSYETLAQGAPLKPGSGYWVQANGDEPLPLRAGNNAPLQIQAPAGQSVLIGDPSGTQPATVSGADSVMTYDAAAGYQPLTTTLQPGQGAWAVSNAGGTITVAPQGTPSSNATAGLKTVSSAKGLSFAIPADWQTGMPPDSLKDADLFAGSTDSAAYAWAATTSLSPGSGVNMLKTLTAINDEQVKGDPSFAVTSSPAETPSPIAGADSAAYTVSTYTGSSSGRTHVQITVAANRNEQVSIFQIDTYASDFAQNQEQIWQIVDSLQLNSPPTP